jgi:hypothetical protein
MELLSKLEARRGRCRKVERKGEEGVIGRAAGDERVFIVVEVSGWQMGRRHNPNPHA